MIANRRQVHGLATVRQIAQQQNELGVFVGSHLLDERVEEGSTLGGPVMEIVHHDELERAQTGAAAR